MARRRAAWQTTLLVALSLYGALLFAVGVGLLVESRQYFLDWAHWPLTSIPLTMMVCLPVLLTGWRQPALARFGAVLTCLLLLLQLLAASSKGDAEAYMMIAATVIVGLPMLGSTFFFRSLARNPQ